MHYMKRHINKVILGGFILLSVGLTVWSHLSNPKLVLPKTLTKQPHKVEDLKTPPQDTFCLVNDCKG